MSDSPLADALARAETHSTYLRGLIRREEDLVNLMQSKGFDEAFSASMERLDPEQPAQSLRSSKAGMALTTALADLSGAWSLERTTAALTDHADRTLDFAIRAAFAERSAEMAGFAALALGKMGSRELNYSSDIDLIFIHDPDRLPGKAGEDPTETAVRIARRASTLLSERTGDGYCWRVDLRLRPDPDSTPSSLPVAAAEQYYQSQALAWERSAFVRARAAAGDLRLGREFLAEIEPFIWRRSLDYSALADIREVSHRIRDHFAEGQKFGPGFDMKRGRGGIREIEFFAQIHQLIFGGREPSLRVGATLDALAALAAAGRITETDALFLSNAYRQFRTVEHRFQMIGDQQTHMVPKQKPEREAVAGLMGAENWKAVESTLLPNIRGVRKLYDKLLISTGDDGRGKRLPFDQAAVEAWARKARIADPTLLATLLQNWRGGQLRSLRTSEARQAFEAVAPSLIQQMGTGRRGRENLLRLDRMIRALPSGVQFWRLLAAHPKLTDVVARLLSTTPMLAEALAARPDLIDVLLEPSHPLADIETARRELSLVTSGLNGEPLLDRVRNWTAEHRFQLGVNLIDGHVSPFDASRTMALMAEATVELLAESVTADFAQRHGRVPDSELVVLALGRLGGGELTTQSDLDLILTFTGSFQKQSDGPHPLSASSWYNRLGQRLIAALSVPTAAGELYQVDTRLRPSGADGLLVVSLDSFAQYQRESKEIWEAMAITRARPITGSVAARAAAQQIIDAAVSRPRDPELIRREAVAIRRHMAKHKPAAGPFDVKLLKGGLVDLEFIIQARALLAERPVPAGMAESLVALAPELIQPARLMMATLVMLRLVQSHGATSMSTVDTGAIARACGCANLTELKAELAAARAIVKDVWAETFAGH